MKKYIIITADTNDGDYVTQKTLIKNDISVYTILVI